jgi:hypothetical protein
VDSILKSEIKKSLYNGSLPLFVLWSSAMWGLCSLQRTQCWRCHLESRKQSLPDIGTWILDLPAIRTVRNKILINYPVCGFLLGEHKWSNIKSYRSNFLEGIVVIKLAQMRNAIYIKQWNFQIALGQNRRKMWHIKIDELNNVLKECWLI